VRLTSLDCLRTPICALSTPSVSPSCQRISSSLAASVENVLKFTKSSSLFLRLTKYYLLAAGAGAVAVILKCTKSSSVLGDKLAHLMEPLGTPWWTSFNTKQQRSKTLQILSSIVFLTFFRFSKCYNNSEWISSSHCQ